MYIQNMIEEEFIPYELALELKQLEYDKESFGRYNGEGYLYHNSFSPFKYHVIPATGIQSIKNYCLAPTFSQAFRWFREKYNLHVEPIWDIIDSELIWFYSISEVGNLIKDYIDLPHCKTPEQAELECLKQLIEIISYERRR